jgi:Flp pilus assembly protein TadG
MSARNCRGNVILESAMLIPVMVLLLVGMAQIAKITYLYVTLKKTVYSVAAYLSTQQGVNFCDTGDPLIAAAINFGLTGTTDNSLPVFVGGLTPEMISVTPQRIDGTDYASGCVGSPSFAGTRPDFITVSIPNGFLVQLRIPLLPATDPIPLKPSVQVPYGGT